jgi:hypothetical protein
VLEEDPREPRYLQTVHRKGYRFIAHNRTGGSRADVALEPARPEQLSTSVVPAFGRASEVAKLHRELDLAKQGGPRLAFVTGEAGEGKTTVVQVQSGGAALNPVPSAATVVTRGNLSYQGRRAVRRVRPRVAGSSARRPW